jgi:hypothetical protein
MKISAFKFLRTAAIGCAIGALSGCAGAKLLSGKFPGSKAEEFAKADARNPAAEVLAIWQAAEGHGVNGLPTRGFAGQILFVTNRSSSPVTVEGEVRIYLFDDKGKLEEQAKPIHQFDFKPGAWKTHMRPGTLGPSYHVFIPYVRKDRHQANCTLMVRLKPTDGPTIYSDMTTIMLPGPAPDKKNNAIASRPEKIRNAFNDSTDIKFANVKADPGKPKIKQVSDSVDVNVGHPTEARIHRLERMLAELVESQAGRHHPEENESHVTDRPESRTFQLTRAPRNKRWPAEESAADDVYENRSNWNRRNWTGNRRRTYRHPLADDVSAHEERADE